MFILKNYIVAGIITYLIYKYWFEKKQFEKIAKESILEPETAQGVEQKETMYANDDISKNFTSAKFPITYSNPPRRSGRNF
jgi:hypothetical protein